MHTVALSMSTLIVFELLTILGIGLENIAAIEDEPVSISDLWTQDIAMLLTGLIGVGWLSRRKMGESLARLGIVKPSVQEVALGMGVVWCWWCSPSVWNISLPFSGSWSIGRGEIDGTIARLFVQNDPGILTLGFAAAIGEETVFRGRQPRFGLLLTSLCSP